MAETPRITCAAGASCRRRSHASLSYLAQKPESRRYLCQWIRPVGEAGWLNIYRWCNKEFSEVVTQMALCELDAPEMMDLHRQAMTIRLDELPDIPVMETMIVLPMNTTYWTGWPSCDDQYVHEGFWHRTAMLMWPRLEPTQ